MTMYDVATKLLGYTLDGETRSCLLLRLKGLVDFLADDNDKNSPKMRFASKLVKEFEELGAGIKDSLDAEEDLQKRYDKLLQDYAILQDKYDAAISGAADIEDWKDLVIQALPDEASVAMANDVEAALDQFKSVY